MNKITLSILFITLAVSTLSAQVTDQTEIRGKTNVSKHPHQEKIYTIATHPLYNFNGGVRFDFEKRIKNTSSWIQAGVSGYLMPKIKGDYGYNQWIMITGDELNRLSGAGLELNYKHFFNRNESLYFAGGCSYSHYNIEYTSEYWDSYIENDLKYHTKKLGDMRQKINKLGINTYFGYQVPRPTFLFDMFVGLGYRYSFRSNDVAKLFNDYIISWGYTGVVFITGVRFGVKF
jgi:hypothetical protein